MRYLNSTVSISSSIREVELENMRKPETKENSLVYGYSKMNFVT